jgi:hypothetical protein
MVLSQPCTPISEMKRPNILSLIKESRPSTPKKKLYCPPLAVLPEETKRFGKLSRGPDFMYSMVAFTSDYELNLPESLSNCHTYVFKGGEKDVQIAAWQSFREHLDSPGLHLIEFRNAVFLVKESGCAIAKALTGSAYEALSRISEAIEKMSISDMIGFVEKDLFDGKEKLNLYSSMDFYYATNIPVSVSRASFCGTKGKRFRVMMKGHIFASLVNDMAEDVVMSTSGMY